MQNPGTGVFASPCLLPRSASSLVQSTRQDDHLEQIQEDLLATQRYHNLYRNAEYPERNDAR